MIPVVGLQYLVPGTALTALLIAPITRQHHPPLAIGHWPTARIASTDGDGVKNL